MSLETIEKIASTLGNEELAAAVSGLKQSSSSSLDRVNKLESDLQKAIEKRDRQAQLVKSTFGLEELTEDALKSVLDKAGKTDPDATKAETQQLMSLAEKLKKENEELSQKYQYTKNQYKIEKSLAKIGALEDTKGSKAYDILLSEITNGATFDENGILIFKANDGTTVRNADSSPVTLEQRYEALKNNEDLSFLFKEKRSKSGSGTSGTQGSTSAKAPADYTEQERVDLYRRDPQRFQQLFG